MCSLLPCNLLRFGVPPIIIIFISFNSIQLPIIIAFLLIALLKTALFLQTDWLISMLNIVFDGIGSATIYFICHYILFFIHRSLIIQLYCHASKNDCQGMYLFMKQSIRGRRKIGVGGTSVCYFLPSTPDKNSLNGYGHPRDF